MEHATGSPSTSKLAQAFDTFNKQRIHSTVIEEIWSVGFGKEYASEARPDAFYTQSVLDRIASAVGSRTLKGSLLDIGCGHGLPGIYLAKRLKADRLIGIDISSASIELARKHALSDKVQADFRVGDGASTGLADESVATAICLDVILYMQDKVATIKEVYRVLEPTGLFAFTTWEQQGYNARLGAEQSDDYRSLLEDAGFVVQEYGVVDESNKLQCQVFNEILAREDDLLAEIGYKPALMLVDMAKSALEESTRRRYILAIAQKIE
jgi:ubiquinone/menaquinone biosynthesis C-methylase UbiE